MIDNLSIWPQVAVTLHMLGAAACAGGAIWISQRPLNKRSDRIATIVALIITSIWACISAAYGSLTMPAQLAELARNLGWIFVIYRLFTNDGRDRGMAGIRPVVMALAFVELLQFALLLVDSFWANIPELSRMIAQTSAMFHILVAVGALVLLHNLYAGASSSTREVLRWSAAGIAGFWAFELNHHVIAYLGEGPSPLLGALRGLMVAMMVIPVAVGASNGLAGRKLRPSRTVAFQTLSLLVIGAYLISMFGISQLLTVLDGSLSRLAQIGFLVIASALAILWLPSNRARSWLRVTALKHLFQHRYDYREEWLRLTATMGEVGPQATSLPSRVAKAMAELTESPAAIVFLPDEDGVCSEAASWNWTYGAAATLHLPAELTSHLLRKTYVMEVENSRSGPSEETARPTLPTWLVEDSRAWVLAPLIHFDRLVGVVLLARPAVSRPLDWEDLDIIKVAGRQLASYLAEYEGQQSLMEASQFEDFNRRIAFVMHDIKNLASQLSLLVRNAELHADNAEFRADMLVTLRASADKLNTLLARLGRYGTQNTGSLERVDMAALCQNIAKRLGAAHPVTLTRLDHCVVRADVERLDQALVHLVQNAIDASAPDMPVFLEVTSDGIFGRIDVVDTGTGMDASFVRNGLFKPFVSSKRNGFGIGAFEARELIRAMSGRLDVQSRPELGTKFTISVPLAEAAKYFSSQTNSEAA
ncbi:PEP-CTERM system histidine kinase PrsK [Altererythrobacter sp.]|nr:PEP-CTERM system histidine kinase PrsK [Altererythrobacter sp.]